MAAGSKVEAEMTASRPAVAYKSPLHQMTQTTPTMLWNDSADVDELKYAIDNGAVGATCNPVIALGILKKEIAVWRPRIQELMREMPGATEDQIGWKLVEEMSVRAAKLLEPAFAVHQGRNGRLSIQTDPRFYRDANAILDNAVRFGRIAKNIIVKIPATKAGITAIEEATALGLSINATVCFTLPQCLAVAEAVERGLRRREQAGQEIESMGPVCTIMVGRLDDWLKVMLDKREISVDPGYLEWAGVAVFKKTYGIFKQRGYRLRLLAAAYRNHMQWSELIGADAVISPPSAWQKRFNASDIEVRPRINDPVDPKAVEQLLDKFPDFRRAYTEDGLTVDEFDSFPPTVRTLRQFIAACSDLDGLVRDVMLPEPS
jgi:transaldolase